MINPAWLKARAADVLEADAIDPALYERYSVKRGLRNADGTGVLVSILAQIRARKAETL